MMLDAVLRMPPEIWCNEEFNKQQRYSRYLQAADELEKLRTELDQTNAFLKQVADACQEAECGNTKLRAEIAKARAEERARCAKECAVEEFIWDVGGLHWSGALAARFCADRILALKDDR